MVFTLACFVAAWVTWLSFAFDAKEWGRGMWIMLETHIMRSSLIFHLVLTLVFHLALLLVLCHVSLMDLTIAHMVLVHERTTLCLDALVTAHVFMLELLTLTLN
jgi:hypothetical protein